jgi:type II secretory pathway component HofQ
MTVHAGGVIDAGAAEGRRKGTATMNSSIESTAATQTPAVAAPGAPVAPRERASTKAASRKKNAATGQQRATPKAAAPAKAPKTPKGARKAAKAAPAKTKASESTKVAKKATKATPRREFSKKAIVLDMLRAKGRRDHDRHRQGDGLAEPAHICDLWPHVRACAARR